MEKDFKFINQKDIYQYKFYMIPKELFVNERYISLSPAAILLYGILLDRLTLSIKNNWVDKNGNIYLIFTRKEIESILHISDKTCTKTFKELVDAKLLLEKSQGKAKPKLLYPAQMVHDEKFDNLIRKNSDSQGVVDSQFIFSYNPQIKFSTKSSLFQINLSHFQIIFPIIAK